MKIDAHQHFWNYDPIEFSWINEDAKYLRRDFLPTDLKPELDQNGFEGTVAVQAPQTNEETDFLLNLANEFDFIKGVVGWINLSAEDLADQLGKYEKETKLKGFRHIVQAEIDNHFLNNNRDFKKGVKFLGTKGYTYDVLVYPVQLPATIQFCRDLPNQKLVIDHIAKPYITWQQKEPWATQIKELGKMSHVFCKVSGMVTEADWNRWKMSDFDFYLETIFEAFGPQRLMFGSDWPVCQVAATYAQTLEIVSSYTDKLSETEKADVFGNTAARFYNLN